MTRRRQIPWFLLPALVLLVPLAGRAQMVANGTLNATVSNWGGIVLVFNSDAAGVPLGGSGTAGATLNFGTVSMFGTVPARVTRVRSGGSNPANFTISTPFDVNVALGGFLNSASFNLRASLTTAPGTLAYQIAGNTLSTTPVVLSQNDRRYAQNVQYTLAITIPAAYPAQTISNVINFTATAN